MGHSAYRDPAFDQNDRTERFGSGPFWSFFDQNDRTERFGSVFAPAVRADSFSPISYSQSRLKTKWPKNP